MNLEVIKRNKRRNRTKARVRKKIFGTFDRPRISIFKSNKNIFIQAIDDLTGKTLFAIGSNSKKFDTKMKKNKDTAKILGEIFSKELLKLNINTVVIDRRYHNYYGIIETFVNILREQEIKV